ncbi:hypothetical protein EDB89DRAFT_1911469 [Lactarius sanguifluus]|nr:hypothetical protein EDB89DRAFT_1911469 [Lactarius sanguifluus]
MSAVGRAPRAVLDVVSSVLSYYRGNHATTGSKSVWDLVTWDVPPPKDARCCSQPKQTVFADTMEAEEIAGADSKVAMVINSSKSRPIRNEEVRELRSSGAATGCRTFKFAMLRDMQLVDLDSAIFPTLAQDKAYHYKLVHICSLDPAPQATQLTELDAIATALSGGPDPAIFDFDQLFKAHHGLRAANALHAPQDAFEWRARRPACLAATVCRHHWGIWYVTGTQAECWVIEGERPHIDAVIIKATCACLLTAERAHRHRRCIQSAGVGAVGQTKQLIFADTIKAEEIRMATRMRAEASVSLPGTVLYRVIGKYTQDEKSIECSGM